MDAYFDLLAIQDTLGFGNRWTQARIVDAGDHDPAALEDDDRTFDTDAYLD